MVKRILFVCKHNRFRSRVAGAFFNKFNKNKNYVAESGGLIAGDYPLNKEQVKVAKNFGVDISGRPKTMDTNLLRRTDLIVIVADDVPAEIFDNEHYRELGLCKKIILWNLSDVYVNDKLEIKKTIGLIEENVRKLIEDLER